MLTEPNQMNPLTLAYLGDAVYEAFVRERLVKKENFAGHADRMHKAGVSYVCAGAQSEIIKKLMDSLSEEEQSVVKRARNHKTATKAKNASAVDYKWATGFEALIGYLKICGREERLSEIMSMAADIAEGKDNE